MSIPQTPSPLAAIIASGTYDMNWFSGSTPEAKVQAAINAAFADGAPRVLVHSSYDASLIVFNANVKMVREGERWDVYDLTAYGAAGDGVTDDTAAVRAWVGVGTNRHLYAPIGTYLVNPTTTYSLQLGQTIEMAFGATIKLANGAALAADTYIFTATLGADNVTFINVSMNGNRANQTKRIRGIVGFKARNMMMDRCYFVDFGGSAFVITNCPGFRVTRSTWERCGRKWSGATGTQGEQGMSVLCDVASTDPFYSPGNVIAYNRALFCGWDGINFSSPYTKVIGNTVQNCGLEFATVGAAGIYYTSGSVQGPHGSLISGNTVYGCTGNGIDTGPNTTVIAGMQIVDNQCFNNCETGIVLSDGIYFRTEDNKCWNNFQVSTTDENGNTVTPSTKTSEKGGICVTSVNFSVAQSFIRRNICFDDQGGKTQVFGIQLGATNTDAIVDLTCEDNYLVGNLTDAIGTVGTQPPEFVTSGYGAIRRNQGYLLTITSGAAIPNNSEFITVSYSGATNLTSITKGRAEDRVTMLFTNGNATLVNSANLVLRGGINVTPANGNTITFVCDGTSSGANWREISRNF